MSNQTKEISGTKSSEAKKMLKNKTQQSNDDHTIDYARIVDGKRTITIAYRIFPDSKKNNVEFAASIHRKDHDDEVFNRKRHLETARGRLGVRPLHTTFPSNNLKQILERPIPKNKEERKRWALSEEGQKWRASRQQFDEDIAAFLRKELVRLGCKNKRRMNHEEILRRRSGSEPTL